ncbi:hypothetical protein JTB14_003060 [Gonioctena quinquepunctata]|nr:hypothetical protein JTB14_003060 [Gonioctena quinquepunctata]
MWDLVNVSWVIPWVSLTTKFNFNVKIRFWGFSRGNKYSLLFIRNITFLGPLTELELEEIALNLDLDQSDLDDFSSDDDEDEVDPGLENVVPDPDDMEIADNMSDSSDEEPLAHYQKKT